MSKIRISPISKDNYKNLLEIEALETQFYGKEKDSFYYKNFRLTCEALFEKQPNNESLFLASFHKNDITGFIGLYKWTRAPWASLVLFRSNKSFRHLGFKKNGTCDLVREAFSWSRDNNISRIFLVTPLKSRKSYKNSWLMPFAEALDDFSSYSFITESIIPKNSSPLFEPYWRMLGRQTFPIDLAISSVSPNESL